MKISIVADDWKAPAFEKALHAAKIEFSKAVHSETATSIYMYIDSEAMLAHIGNVIFLVDAQMKTDREPFIAALRELAQRQKQLLQESEERVSKELGLQ